MKPDTTENDVESNGESESDASESEEESDDKPNDSAMHHPGKRGADQDHEDASTTKKRKR